MIILLAIIGAFFAPSAPVEPPPIAETIQAQPSAGASWNLCYHKRLRLCGVPAGESRTETRAQALCENQQPQLLFVMVATNNQYSQKCPVSSTILCPRSIAIAGAMRISAFMDANL